MRAACCSTLPSAPPSIREQYEAAWWREYTQPVANVVPLWFKLLLDVLDEAARQAAPAEKT